MSQAIELSDDNFADSIKEGLTLVDFWAPWCGPCRFVAPVLDEIAADYEGKITVAKLNVDDNQKTAMDFRVMSIPTVILFQDGEAKEVLVGARPKGAYQTKIDQYI